MLVAYFVTGVGVIWAISVAKPTRWLYARVFDGCDFCLGVWVFALLAYPFYAPPLIFNGIQYVPVVSEVVCGILASFVTHIFRIGWAVRFHNDNS